MDLMEAIAKRKSVRKYDTKPVDKELIELVIDAGRQAPSGNNVQPCEFVVVTKPAMRNRLAEICPYGRFLKEAPVGIVVFSRETKYYLEDGSAAVENMLLAATSLGLGTCWIAGDKKHYAREIGNMLNVPPFYKLIALVALGYSKDRSPRKSKRSLQEVLHWEGF